MTKSIGQENRQSSQNLSEKFAGFKEKKAYLAWTGRGDIDNTVLVKDRPGFIYVRLPKSVATGTLEEYSEAMALSPTEHRHGVPVLVVKSDFNPSRYVVQEILTQGDGQALIESIGNSVVNHHVAHELHNLSGGHDPVMLDTIQLRNMQVVPTTPSSSKVIVNGGWYVWKDFEVHFFSGAEVELASSVPTGTFALNYVSLWLDPDTQEITTRATATTESEGRPLGELLEWPSSGFLPLAGVRLKAGDYGINFLDQGVPSIIDMRVHTYMMPGDVSTAIGSGTFNTLQEDDVTVLDSGTIINFEGDPFVDFIVIDEGSGKGTVSGTFQKTLADTEYFNRRGEGAGADLYLGSSLKLYSDAGVSLRGEWNAGSGHLSIGSTPQDGHRLLSVEGGLPSASDDAYGIRSTVSVANNTNTLFGIYSQPSGSPITGTKPGVVGIGAKAVSSPPGAAIVANLKAGQLHVENESLSSTVTTAYGLHILTPTDAGGGITTAYGLHIDNQNTATTNYAIWSDGGETRLNAGTATVIPLVVKGAASQSANLTEWQDSTGSVLTVIDEVGRLGIGVAAPSHQMHLADTITDTAGTPFSRLATHTLNPASASSAIYTGNRDSVEIDAGNTQNITGAIVALAPRIFHDGSGTLSDVRANNTVIQNKSTGTISLAKAMNATIASAFSGGTVTDARAFHAIIQTSVAGAIITNAYGIYLEYPTNNGTITNAYGVYIEDVLGTNTWGIYVTPTVDNYLAGKLGIGDTTPDAQLDVVAGAAGTIGTIIEAAASPTANIFEIHDSSSNILSSFSENGYFMTRKVAAPADAEIATSELALWFDDTSGTALLMIKAKDSGGTVRTGSVSLS